MSYIKYLLVIAILATLFFFGNRNETKPEQADNQAVPVSELSAKKGELEISSSEIFERAENVLQAESNDRFRILLRAKSNSKTRLHIKLADISGQQKLIETLQIDQSSDEKPYELLADSDEHYSDIIFEKENPKDRSLILISNISVTRLNKLTEIERLRPTLVGITGQVNTHQSQLKHSNDNFSYLKNRGNAVGQIFQADFEYLTEVILNLSKVGNGGNGKYRLILKKAEPRDGSYSLANDVLASNEFEATELDNFSTKEGIRFPLVARLERGQYYFVGVENNRARTNFFNYLIVQGSQSKDVFQFGDAYWDNDSKGKKIIGDLFFKVVGIDFSQVDGNRLLTAATIEDLGGGEGRYFYKMKHNKHDLFDVVYSEQAENGVQKRVDFGEFEKIVQGQAKEGAAYLYKFYTHYPIDKMRISARQPYNFWNDINLYYSFDSQNWQKVEPRSTEENVLQKFDAVIDGQKNKNTVYLKVECDYEPTKEVALYGLGDLLVEANLQVR